MNEEQEAIFKKAHEESIAASKKVRTRDPTIQTIRLESDVIQMVFFDLYERILDSVVSVPDVPDRLIQDCLFKDKGIEHTVQLIAPEGKRQRALYVKQLVNFLQTWVEMTLATLQIPNARNFIRIEIKLEHRIFSNDFNTHIASALEDNEHVFCITDARIGLEPIQNMDKTTVLKWNSPEILQTFSFECLRVFWHRVGTICLQRQYITEDFFLEYFSDAAWDRMMQKPLAYFNHDGKPYSDPNPNAQFVSPKIEQKIEPIAEVKSNASQ